MSVRVMALVFDMRFGSSSQKLVALSLADHASHDGSGAYPGNELLEHKAELSRATVIRALNELEAAGVIFTDDRQGGRGVATVWNFDMEHCHELATAGRAIWQARLEEKGRTVTRNRGGAKGRNGDTNSRNGTAKGRTVTPQPEEPSEPSIAAPAVPEWAQGQIRLVRSMVADDWRPHQTRPWVFTRKAQDLAGSREERDLLWEAMVDALGFDPETKSERGRWNTALASLRHAAATPLEVRARAAVYVKKWPGVELTVTGLESNWGTLGRTLRPDSPAEPPPIDPATCEHPAPWTDLGDVYRCRLCPTEWTAGDRPPSPVRDTMKQPTKETE